MKHVGPSLCTGSQINIVREGDPRTHGDETWTRNTGQWDELETSGSCRTRQTRMATFGLWPVLHWDRSA